MMRAKLVVITLLILTVLAPAQGVLGQDFSQLLEAVDKLEVNLKALVAQESADRNKQVNNLRKEVDQLKQNKSGPVNNTLLGNIKGELARLRKEVKYLSQAGTGSSSLFSQSDWMTMVNDVEFLKSENLYLRSLLTDNSQQLASLNDGSFPSSSSNEQLAERLNTLNERLQEVLAGQHNSPEGDIVHNINFSGFVDASDYNDHNSGEASFGLDQVEIDIIKEFSGQSLLRADIEYVSDGVGGFNMDLEQGYLSYNLGSRQTWSFTFGKFNAPIGFELLDAPDMYQYSHALVFDNGLPTNLTGLMVSTSFPSVVDWSFYLVNGWDVNSDNNKDKTFGTRLGFTPVENLNFGFSAISGPEQDNNNSSRRTVFDIDLTYNPIEIWTIGGEFNYGHESKIMPDGSAGNWNGFLLMNNVALGDRFGITTRFDYFNDSDGLRTGVAQKWKSFIISPSVSIVDGLGGLFELRYDWSNQDVFVGGDGLSKDNQFITAVEFTYGF